MHNVWLQKISFPLPTEGICPMLPSPHPSKKFQFSIIHCSKYLSLTILILGHLLKVKELQRIEDLG